MNLAAADLMALMPECLRAHWRSPGPLTTFLAEHYNRHERRRVLREHRPTCRAKWRT